MPNIIKKLYKKQNGSVQVFIIVPFLLFFIVFMYEMFVVRYTLSIFIADFKTNADMANFATYKYISQLEISRTGQIVFDESSLNDVYDTFKTYLCKNQKLDNNLKPLAPTSYFSQPLSIRKIIVYSVKNGLMYEYQYDNTTNHFTTVLSGYNGNVKTPTGRAVSKTSVYTEVGFSLDFFGTPYADKALVSYTDVVN